MTTDYPAIWAAVQRASRFEKYASEGGALTDLAAACNDAYELFATKSAAYGRTDSPEDAARCAISFGLDLYNTARGMGEKVASEQAAGSTLEHLGAVALVDATLKHAAESMQGSERAATERLRLLGREYGVELLRNLVG